MKFVQGYLGEAAVGDTFRLPNRFIVEDEAQGTALVEYAEAVFNPGWDDKEITGVRRMATVTYPLHTAPGQIEDQLGVSVGVRRDFGDPVAI